jgi:hypothetical protein
MFRLREIGSEPAAYLTAIGGYAEFETGQSAATYMVEMNRRLLETFGDSAKQYKVEKILDESIDWRGRELHRFADSTYTRVPWWRESWYDQSDTAKNHFAHLSVKQPGRIAYTESVEKGLADKQTPIKPGKYLAKYFGDILSKPRIAELSAMVTIGDNLEGVQIARTADEIERVYTNGPSSCMAYNASHYNGHCHPVRVYGDSDISLAYTVEHGDIVARVLIWESEKIMSTVYPTRGHQGDIDKAADLYGHMLNKGYTRDSFEGAKIQKIEDNNYNGYILPYFDNDKGVNDNGDSFVITNSCAEYTADSEHGVSESGYSCCACGDSVSEEGCYYSDHGDGPYCSECYSERYGTCEHCETYDICREDLHYVESVSKDVCDSCLSSDFVYCDDCNEYYETDDTVTLEPDGEMVCQSCFSKNHDDCADCEKPFHNANLEAVDGDSVCGDCADERKESETPLNNGSPTVQDSRQIELTGV